MAAEYLIAFQSDTKFLFRYLKYIILNNGNAKQYAVKKCSLKISIFSHKSKLKFILITF